MSTVYEDNYGFYITDGDPEELAFFCYIKSQSKLKICVRCNQKVRLQEDVKICADSVRKHWNMARHQIQPGR